MIRSIPAPAGAVMEYLRLSRDPVVLEMKKYRQHGRTDTYRHCVNACLAVCWLAHKLRCREDTVVSAVRASMLHDLYLYDYHKARRAYGKWHAWGHPEAALKNAERVCGLRPVEREAIRCHMFPGTLFHMPRHAAGWLLVCADKICAIGELLRLEPFGAAYLVPA